LLAILVVGCDSVQQTNLVLMDDACRCDHRSLGMVAALRVRLEGPDSRSSACIPQVGQAQRLATLQLTLHGSTSLTDLGSGAYALTVSGYKDASCTSDVVTCGYSTFSLPATAPAIDVPMRCQLDSAGNPTTITEQACLEQTTAPDRCTDQPVGGNNELGEVQLSDGGGCDNNDIENADALAVALYDISGGGPLRRKCLAVPDTPLTLKVVEDSLPTPILTQLSDGQHLLMVTGHDSKGCATDDVVACGGAKLTLPLSAPPTITMTCHDDKSPITEAACLASIK